MNLNVFCFLRALKDAEKAIRLAKDWPKGYFRKGRALAGLNVSISSNFCRNAPY